MLLLLLRSRSTTAVLVLPSSSADWNIAQRTTRSPVSLASLAEVTWLTRVVIIEVAELGVWRIASRAQHNLSCCCSRSCFHLSLLTVRIRLCRWWRSISIIRHSLCSTRCCRRHRSSRWSIIVAIESIWALLLLLLLLLVPLIIFVVAIP